MVNIKDLVVNKDYKGIAKEIRSMKRLWEGKGLDGLLKRREKEANMVESCA
jgi:GH24 family phage-related lysozyme (muramidase)